MISVCVLTHMCGDCRVTLEIGSLYYGFQGSNSDVRFGSHSPSPTEPLLSSPELGFGFFSFLEFGAGFAYFLLRQAILSPNSPIFNLHRLLMNFGFSFFSN